MNNLTLRTRTRQKDSGLRAAPTALGASVAALLGLSVHCVPCHGALLGAKATAFDSSPWNQTAASQAPGNRPNSRHVSIRPKHCETPQPAKLDPGDRSGQVRRPGLSALVRLAEELTTDDSSQNILPSEKEDDVSHQYRETVTGDSPTGFLLSASKITVVRQPAGNISSFSPLLRLAEQLTRPGTAAIPDSDETTKFVAVIEETPQGEAEEVDNAAYSSTNSTVLFERVPINGGSFSPLLKFADQMAYAASADPISSKNFAAEVFGDEQRAKNVCVKLPAIPESAPGAASPEALGPRLPLTGENPVVPLENKLFDPNLLDEQPLDLETRIRNAAPPEQFAPQELLSAPRPLALIPEVAVKVPVVDANRSFLEATVPGDVSMDARPFLRQEEFAIDSQPGPFSQIHLGEKLTLDWGGIGIGLIFDDNFRVTDGNAEADMLLTISSGLTLTLGSTESRFMARANYSASGVFFLSNSNENSFNQSLSFEMAYRMQRLTLGLHIRPSMINGSSVDAGDRVGRKIFYAGLTANYTVSDKTSISLNTDYTYAGYDGLLSSRETRVQGFLNYLVTPKVTLGLGGGYGILDVDGGQTQTSQQALVQVSYAATAKLGFNANAGWEFRNGGDGVPTSSTPVFSVGAAWTPREKTTISFDARRRTYGSAALVGQNYQATGFSATITQQLRPRISANLTVGYEFTNYQQALLGVDASRRDNYFYTRVGVGFPVNRWCSGNVFYEFSNNSSTGNGARAFDRNRVGMFLSCQF